MRKRRVKLTTILSVIFVFGCGVLGAMMFAIVGGTKRYDPIRLFGAAVGALGARLPDISTPYGKIHLRTKLNGDGLDLHISCAKCELKSERLARIPFITDSASVDGYYESRRFRGTIQVDEVSALVDTLWEKGQASGKFHLQETPIAKIFYAVRSIVPEADSAEILGTVAGKGKFSWPNIDLLVEPKIDGFSVNGLVDKEKYQSGEFSIEVYKYREDELTEETVVFKSGEGNENWMSLKEIGNYLPSAVIAAEDGGFYSHPGYNIQSIVEATKYNKELNIIKRGGSTITQQLAKNLFLSPERTYSRKLRELLYAVELDRELGKKRVLEIYLNIVEWGPNIRGAKQASLAYFGKAPNKLLPEEAAWLASILKSPIRAWKSQFMKNRPNTAWVDVVLRRMSGISDNERNSAISRQIYFSRYSGSQKF